jgi:glycosyltransferase involved in cell wall biosynthesis
MAARTRTSMADAPWPQAFEQSAGRKLRVLHVGNIGNNAYLNATFLRRAGVECHVICHDYYDLLGTPEWEHGRGTRPPWFAQGPFPVCERYLKALDDDDRLRRLVLWQRMRFAQAFPPAADRGSQARRAISRIRVRTLKASMRIRYYRSYFTSLMRWLARRAAAAIRGVPPHSKALPNDCDGRVDELIALFAKRFPSRADQLTHRDIEGYGTDYLSTWRRLFQRYDVVQCYSTDPIRPLLCGYRPYVAFEHGTLRAFTMNDDAVSRLTALGYRESDHTFITNGDCLPYAERLGIERYSPMIHPLDVDMHAKRNEAGIRALRRSLAADVVLFCPMRHDWAIKGTDTHIRALPLILERIQMQVMLALCEWGADVAEAKRLISLLGIDRSIRWFPRMPRQKFIMFLQAADVVLDQMTLPHFDATVPQALAAGTPVIMSYEPESTAWLVSEPAPVISAFDEEGVARGVGVALDPEWRTDFRARAATWIREHHHPDWIVAEHIRVYRNLVGHA